MASDGHCERHILCAAEAIERLKAAGWVLQVDSGQDLRPFYDRAAHQTLPGKMSPSNLIYVLVASPPTCKSLWACADPLARP